ncbi:hypothetical protein RSAG8_03440, partial [Rhizoctonia solani AG-8 WAC10335]
MSLFRTPSFRLKKREKAHRPPPLEEMPERREQETAETVEVNGSSFLVVPDTARSTFFTLSSGMNSRSSLFGRNSTSSQDEKKRSALFKLPNLSRGSFILKRERKGRPDELAPISGDGYGYVPKSKRSESASNLLEWLVKPDRSAPPQNLNVRQRPRTLSTKSLPDTPDHQRRVFTDIPRLDPLPPFTVRASLETPSKPKAVSVPPRLSLDTRISRVSPIRLPSFSGLSRLGPISPSIMDPPSPTSPTLDEPTIVLQKSLHSPSPTVSLHSPSPTVVSSTTMSTIQDSLLGDYGTSSSESDHDQTFAPREDKHRSSNSFTAADGASTDSKKRADGPDRTPTLTVTSSGQTSPLEPPSRNESVHPFASIPELPDVVPSPFWDPLESYSTDIPARSSSRNSIRSFEASASQLGIPTTPVHKLATNPARTGASPLSPSPSPRKPRPRKLPPAVITSHFKPLPTRSNTLTVPTDGPPATPTSPSSPSTPSSPSFVLGLAWPRPPLRQIYINPHKPGASWHAVSRTIDERLIDGTGMINTDPCHVIMLAHARAGAGTGITESFAHSGMGGGRRRSGTVMRSQQPLTPTAVSALVSFTVRTAPLHMIEFGAPVRSIALGSFNTVFVHDPHDSHPHSQVNTLFLHRADFFPFRFHTHTPHYFVHLIPLPFFLFP